MKIRILPLIFLELGFTISSCRNNVDAMVEDYTSQFAVIYEEAGMSVKDDDFDPEKMLLTDYSLDYRDALYLAGPKDGNTYKWTVEHLVDWEQAEEAKKEGIDLTDTEEKLGESRYITLTLSSSLKFEKYKAYRLRLYVTDAAGTEYSDETVLTITALY